MALVLVSFYSLDREEFKKKIKKKPKNASKRVKSSTEQNRFPSKSQKSRENLLARRMTVNREGGGIGKKTSCQLIKALICIARFV